MCMAGDDWNMQECCVHEEQAEMKRHKTRKRSERIILGKDDNENFQELKEARDAGLKELGLEKNDSGKALRGCVGS